MITTVGLFLLYNFTRFYDIWLIVIMACNCTWNTTYRIPLRIPTEKTVKWMVTSQYALLYCLFGEFWTYRISAIFNHKNLMFSKEMSKINILLILLGHVEWKKCNWRCVVAPQRSFLKFFFSQKELCVQIIKAWYVN